METNKNISAQQEELSQQAQEEGKEIADVCPHTILEQHGSPVILPHDEMVTMYYPSIVAAMDEYANKKTSSLQQEVDKMRFMIDNGLGWDDMKNDNVPPQEK